jgi:hypothetical protein
MGVRVKKTPASKAKMQAFKKTSLKKPKPVAKPAPKKRAPSKRRSK